MANDGTGANWDETDPADGALLRQGALQERDLRTGLRLRLSKEHSVPAAGTITTGSLGNTGGGEHLPGSATAYNGATTPTKRPDGVTNLGTSDKGRIWIDETSGKIYGWNGAAWSQLNAAGTTVQAVVIQDIKSASTDGGSFTSGSWQQRVLSNIAFNPDSVSWCSLASNQFTLGAGTYALEARAPAFQVNRHQARLNNITDSSPNFALGTVGYSVSAGSEAESWSHIQAVFTIAASKTFQIDHQCETTKTFQGLGYGVTWGSNIYTTVKITKLH